MPAPRDLTGEVYGALTVIKKTGHADDSRKSAIWLCHCSQCGRDEEISQLKLPYNASQSRKNGIRYACTICSRGPCVTCGGEIKRQTKKNTCSDLCESEKEKAKHLKHYYKKQAEDPEFNQKRHKAEVERMAEDPELADQVRARRRRAADRYRSKPENQKKAREYQKIWYQENKEHKQEQNKAWWDSIPEPDRTRLKRQYARESKQRFRQRLYQNPDKHQAFLSRMREYRLEWYSKKKAQEAMAELRELALKLQEKYDNE